MNRNKEESPPGLLANVIKKSIKQMMDAENKRFEDMGIEVPSSLSKAAKVMAGTMLKNEVGAPQGLSYSPFIACMTLWEVCKKWEGKLTMYMDDGILYGDVTNKDVMEFHQDCISRGIDIAPMKSRWIKRNGEWLNKLDFLGIRYDPWKGTMEGKTRNGSTFRIPAELWDHFKYEVAPGGSSGNRPEAKVRKMDILGFLISLMYNNGRIYEGIAKARTPRKNSIMDILSKNKVETNTSSEIASKMGPVLKELKWGKNSHRSLIHKIQITLKK